MADISDRNVVVALLAHLGLPPFAPPLGRALRVRLTIERDGARDDTNAQLARTQRIEAGTTSWSRSARTRTG